MYTFKWIKIYWTIASFDMSWLFLQQLYHLGWSTLSIICTVHVYNIFIMISNYIFRQQPKKQFMGSFIECDSFSYFVLIIQAGKTIIFADKYWHSCYDNYSLILCHNPIQLIEGFCNWVFTNLLCFSCLYF